MSGEQPGSWGGEGGAGSQGSGDHVGSGVGMNQSSGAEGDVCLHGPANPGAGPGNRQVLVRQALQPSHLCKWLPAQGPLPETLSPGGHVLPAVQNTGGQHGIQQRASRHSNSRGGCPG